MTDRRIDKLSDVLINYACAAAKDDPQALGQIRLEVAEFCRNYPMPH